LRLSLFCIAPYSVPTPGVTRFAVAIVDYLLAPRLIGVKAIDSPKSAVNRIRKIVHARPKKELGDSNNDPRFECMKAGPCAIVRPDGNAAAATIFLMYRIYSDFLHETEI